MSSSEDDDLFSYGAAKQIDISDDSDSSGDELLAAAKPKPKARASPGKAKQKTPPARRSPSKPAAAASSEHIAHLKMASKGSAGPTTKRVKFAEGGSAKAVPNVPGAAAAPVAAAFIPVAGASVLASWTCPHCQSEQLSVMPHVAARWEATGCPQNSCKVAR
jgi:hypothetical protein